MHELIPGKSEASGQTHAENKSPARPRALAGKPRLAQLQEKADRSPQSKQLEEKQELAGKGSGAQPGNSESEQANETASPEMKKERLQEAQNYLEEVMAKAKTQAEISAQFPFIREKFGLRDLEWKFDGSQAKIFMKINPEANILLKNSELLLGPWHTDHISDKGKVAFKPGSVSLGGKSYNVGLEMEATKLGPHHPQGGPPTSSGIRAIMTQLPTTPKNKADQKYIKGHLLNDNLGGPGVTENLFPITAAANKQHESEVERFVKHWVNEKGWWVYYKVKVANIKEVQVGLRKMINADFECHAYPLNASGKRIILKGFSKTIHSVIGDIPDSGALLEIGLPEGDFGGNPVVGGGFDKEKVKWSTSHGDPSAPMQVDPDVHTISGQVFQLLKKYVEKGADVNRIIQSQLLNSGINANRDFLTRLILDPYLDIEQTTLNVGTWNGLVNLINQNKGKVTGWLNGILSELRKKEHEKRLERMRIARDRRMQREIRKLLRRHKIGKLSLKKKKYGKLGKSFKKTKMIKKKPPNI